MTDLSHSDVDLIRPANPRHTRLALTALALIAAGSFVAGLGRQIVGPLLFAPSAEDPAHAAIAQAQPLTTAVQPVMQVAPSAPVRRAPPKLDVPDPEPAAAPSTQPLAAAPAPEPSAEAPAAPTVDPAPPPTEASADPAAPATDPPVS